ncbi:cytochrome oxidase putative small subunit CydP [Sideroxydans sp. CL21]|uniref:cytochrome oxidase putative small subunit CydP n=1 Tax=Sideroxydans sp. CL21 TaxID=2600596 RepID=UPI0012A8E6CA|nr:cytochrome oxidase putative small subunit CydP [Sideroxydans sp. CL21]VVC82387.1 hypothetical protein [Sideroxydans sp. CL21]
MQLPRLKRNTGGARKTLRREIAVALAIKFLVLYGLWYAFFSHPSIHGMTEGMNPDRVAAALIAPLPANTTEPHEESHK